ncbi:MAG: IS200/IS605 family transposase [Bdellovibrionaceae bacterium]|nr:IS200/IS605 family transposase [Pseudobdellovibrionaceae bacterium]
MGRIIGFHRSSHSVFECQYHIVWSTKYRKRVMTLAHEKEYCEQLLRRAAIEYGINILSVEVDDDHVHIYIEIPPQTISRRCGQDIKERQCPEDV